MARVTCAVSSRKRRKRVLKLAKGFYGDRKNHIRLTKDAVMKALAYNYIHRKKKKSDFRRLWIIRINIAAKINGISYSKLMNGLKKAQCLVNRKVLANLALNDPKAFSEIALKAKKALA
ncbi:MAG: 50S ribosomal protein L20 [Candidatus Anoxychlamydiales bacterium]|nr:50S ribosomal protein L20 [Candidatus Anoxychlamydiales bacterium]NGX41726.1 50S ribosomal protein L20 [Candidatus Anoxychlamydiales bacterium]HEU64812.1 50S ribosomal protein L20 [Chlamydiota bacterium]